MGLDIYLALNKNEIIATIDSLQSIEIALEEFSKKTGITIDPYGTTHLYADHIQLIFSLIPKPNQWTIVFQKALDANTGLIIEGD